MRLFAPLYFPASALITASTAGFREIIRFCESLFPWTKWKRKRDTWLAKGFRNILLVSGEHPKFVSNGYLRDVVRRLVSFVPSVSLEVAPMEVDDYRPLVSAGAEGLVVYQETYDRETYAAVHTAGPKRDFDWRLETPERAYAAGFRRIGIAALFGLAEWRTEAIALAEHLEYLLKKCWRSQLTVSLPRIRPAAGGFRPRFSFSDRDLIQVLCALRITFPQVGIVLSTRESADFRDALMPIGVTMMSAGSRTEPGGYTGQGTHSLHLTVKGRVTHSTGGDRRQTANSRSRTAVLQTRSLQRSEPMVWSLSGKIGILRFLRYEANAQRTSARDGDRQTLSDLLASLQLADKLVLVERNGDAVQRADFPVTTLAEGDTIEIVRLVGGG